MKIFNSYWWKDLYYNYVSCVIWPRQRWLTKVIPRTYRDKDTLIELILFKCLTEYCEVEIGLNNKTEIFDVDENHPVRQIKFESELWENYKLLKEEIPILEKQLDYEWSSIPTYNLDEIAIKVVYDDHYRKINELGNEIVLLKNQILEWIVKNRSSLWS